MTARTYSDRERRRLEEFGRRRTVEALVDIAQTHLSDYVKTEDRGQSYQDTRPGSIRRTAPKTLESSTELSCFSD
ncbi:hypothetical protein [Halobaculum sp. D14]|uniref:hypothetical protein n=1 Tax=Halobaculum sp. D14 TaxID=3421642 RepID=UPI003EB97D8B